MNSSSFPPSPQSFPGFVPFESLFAWVKGCELIGSSSLLCFVALHLFDDLFILCCQQILQKLSVDHLFFYSKWWLEVLPNLGLERYRGGGPQSLPYNTALWAAYVVTSILEHGWELEQGLEFWNFNKSRTKLPIKFYYYDYLIPRTTKPFTFSP